MHIKRASRRLQTVGIAALLSSPYAAQAQASESMHLMRVNPSGSMDTAFGADGHLIDNVSTTSGDRVTAITTNSSSQLPAARRSTAAAS